MTLYVHNIGYITCTTHIPSVIIVLDRLYSTYIYSYPRDMGGIA